MASSDISIWMGIGLGRSAPFPYTLLTDHFDRTENATTLGTAVTGQAWSNLAGTFGISNNEAYCASDADGAIAMSAPVVSTGDFSVHCKIKGSISDGSNTRRLNLIFKGIDGSNFLYISHVANQLTIRKVDTDVFTQIGTTATVATIDNTYYMYKVVCRNGVISVYVNDVFATSYTMTGAELTKFQPAARVGWRLNNSGAPLYPARADNMRVTL
jgi:hypothetical protein